MENQFAAQVELLKVFLSHREQLVARIQELLNAQRKPSQYLQDAALLAHQFETCFFTQAAITPEQQHLKGQLQQAHRASGFRPREMAGVHNDLIDPAQMMIRAFHFWQQTRWPGRNARLRYAHTLFNLYLLRCLELLSMRLWDPGPGDAGARLAQVQELLDQLWQGTPADQPLLVRDARWLIPLAQSPTNDELAPYFVVAKHIADSLPQADQSEIGKATVQMAGGHLRSQLRHYCMREGVSLAENRLVLSARNSNALDFAMTIQNLLPLFQAYARAVQDGDARARLELAGAICQGISADPELFINRPELLSAYSMIEELFVTMDGEGHAAYTPMGRRHVELLEEYAARMPRVARSLLEDLPHFKPIDGSYSPYGAIFGFSSNLTEHVVLKSLQTDAVTGFSIEDVFADEDTSAAKLAWVSGWRKLPHIKQDVQRLFDYPQEFAEAIYARIDQALGNHVGHERAGSAERTGRLFIVSQADPKPDPLTASIADLPVRYILSSDAQIVAAGHAQHCDEAALLRDRQEGMFAVSYRTAGGWVAITKDFFTEILGAGCDLKVAGLPDAAAQVLRLTCAAFL